MGFPPSNDILEFKKLRLIWIFCDIYLHMLYFLQFIASNIDFKMNNRNICPRRDLSKSNNANFHNHSSKNWYIFENLSELAAIIADVNICSRTGMAFIVLLRAMFIITLRFLFYLISKIRCWKMTKKYVCTYARIVHSKYLVNVRQ